MAKARKYLCMKLECSLFNQIVLFSASGLSFSLVLVKVYDLRLADMWI
jgi:hypothetical protein